MSRLMEFVHDGKLVELVKPHRVMSSENTFTVVVGKNGIGKSRLLAQIAKFVTQELLPIRLEFAESRAPHVIAVSTSPFDKFPNARKRAGLEVRSNYRYVGMRGEGMFAASSAVSLIASASRGLLEKLLSRKNNANLLHVFETLNFSPVVDFVFKPGYIASSRSSSTNLNLDKVGDVGLSIDLRCMYNDYGIVVDERYHQLLESFSLAKRHKVFNSMIKINNVIDRRKAVELTVDFARDVSLFDGSEADNSYIESLLILMDAGLMRLMDLRLQKLSFGELSLKRASSGEQCLLVLILGVAGHIRDGSLVLIDEPEISLHPKWQEEFMMLLTTSFSDYKGCQFIVATHSPQIIARLKDKGCFVASLSKGKLYDAEDFFQRSADYQLAELFDAPGIMNEYISRLAFNLLARVKASKSMTDESAKDLERLLELDVQVECDDPVKELISSVVDVCKSYADH